MKNLFFALAFMLVGGFWSCNDSDNSFNDSFNEEFAEILIQKDDIIDESHIEVLNTIENNLSSRINNSGIKQAFVSKDSELFITAAVYENNRVLGRYFQFNGESIYLSLEDYNSEVTLYFLGRNLKYTFGTKVENGFISTDVGLLKSVGSIDGHYYKNEEECEDVGAFGFCYAGVLLAGLGIAFSDGPAPIMDVIAVATVAHGTASCFEEHC